MNEPSVFNGPEVTMPKVITIFEIYVLFVT